MVTKGLVIHSAFTQCCHVPQAMSIYQVDQILKELKSLQNKGKYMDAYESQ